MNPQTARSLRAVLDLEAPASPSQIRHAYLRLVKVWHPDRFASDPDLQARAAEKLKTINDAYARLRALGGAGRETGDQTETRHAHAEGRFVGIQLSADAGKVVATWVPGVPHPNLAGHRPQMALLGLLLGRALACADAHARTEWLLFSDDLGAELEAGRALGETTCSARQVLRTIACDARAHAPWRAWLVGAITLRLGATGIGESGAPPLACALGGLASLTDELPVAECARLGRLLRAVAAHFASPAEIFEPGSETAAMHRAVTLLDPLVGP